MTRHYLLFQRSHPSWTDEPSTIFRPSTFAEECLYMSEMEVHCLLFQRSHPSWTDEPSTIFIHSHLR
jgi:hypothetical protein